MIKNIFCFICLLLIHNSFGQNLRFDEEGNLLNSRNSGRPIDFMKLVASKVKGEEKDGGKKEESEKSSETIQDIPETGDPEIEDPEKETEKAIEGSKEDVHTENAKDELKVLKKLHTRLLETKDKQEKADLRQLIMEKVEKIEKLLHKNKLKQGDKEEISQKGEEALKKQFLALPENGDEIELTDSLINKMENDEIILVDHKEVTEQDLADEVLENKKSTDKKEKSEESSEESSQSSSSEESGMVNDKFDDVGLLQDPVDETTKPSEIKSHKKDKMIVGRSRSANVEEKNDEKVISQSNDIVADYLETAGANEIILDPVSSKEKTDAVKNVLEHEDHKQAKTTTPLVPLYDWNDDNEEITPVETKEEENPETETTEESAAETEEKTTTEDPQIVKFYPWESPVCKDKSDACESFKHMCSLFSIVAYRQCRKTCKLCYHDKPKHRILRTQLTSSSMNASITLTQTNPDAPTFLTTCATLSEGNHTFSAVIHSFGEVMDGGKRCTDFGDHYNPFGASHGDPQDSSNHVGDLGILNFQENFIPKKWPEDVAVCEKSEFGAFNMFDHINLFSELSPENHPVAIYNGEAPLKEFDAKNVIACGLLGRL